MENYRRSGFILFFLGILLLLGLSKAENKTEPRRNVNLGPIEGWRSAYYCMMYNISPSCTNLGWGLTDKGVVTVSLDQIDVYCDQGCYAHTMAVRKCINDVKRGFWFATRAHVQYVSDTISKGCSARKAFATADYKASSGIKVYQKAYVSVISSLVVLVAIFDL